MRGERLLLTRDWWHFVAEARRATLATIGPEGRPAVVPICHAVVDGIVYSPLDEKPKRAGDPRRLQRVRNLLADPRAMLLVDRWDEDWGRLAFVQLVVTGRLLEPGPPEHGAAVAALRAKYAQYDSHRLEDRPVLRLEPTGVGARWAAGPLEIPRSS